MRQHDPKKLFVCLTALSLGLCMSVEGVKAQSMMTSLENHPGQATNLITPMREVSPEPEALQPLVPATNQGGDPARQSTDASVHPVSLDASGHQSESSAVHRPRSFGLLDDQSKRKPISYSPLPGIVIFPVVKHNGEKAFGDLPVLFAREYAQRLELKVPETKVYHPIYTVDELRMQGLGHVYDQIMAYYIRAGRPEPLAMDYLLKQLSENSQPISRVIFVEADLDTTHPSQATGLGEWIMKVTTDGTPKQMRYFVHSRIQVFDAENPEFPMVWGGGWTRSIKTNQFLNVTRSVYADSDSQQAFARLSRDMSREVLYITPKTAYMEPQYDTAVQAQLVSNHAQTKGTPNFSELKRPAQRRLTIENQETIQRILQRQH